MLTQGGGEYPFFSHNGQKVYWTSGAAIYRANPDGTGEGRWSTEVMTLITSSEHLPCRQTGKTALRVRPLHVRHLHVAPTDGTKPRST
ncbi:MAG: hypothetical protein IPM21_12005 [Acidobacteria bacterium]|nr:hypothetical protein [Acidobacteriota bacterium]